MGAARHRGGHGQPGFAGEQRQVAGAVTAQGDARLRPQLGECAPLKSYDDFEEIGIHSTILIDKDGRVHWAQHGGAPFSDFTFLSRSCSA